MSVLEQVLVVVLILQGVAILNDLIRGKEIRAVEIVLTVLLLWIVLKGC